MNSDTKTTQGNDDHANLEPLKLIAMRLRIGTNALTRFLNERGITEIVSPGRGRLFDPAIVEAAVSANRAWFSERAARIEREQAAQRSAAEERRAKVAQQPVPEEALPQAVAVN